MRVVSIPLLLSVLAVLPAAAQTSLGFAEPQDVSALLDYRLPDWSYRTWDASFNLNGRGNEARLAGAPEFGNTFASAVGTSYFQAWESEDRDLRLRGSTSGNYSRMHSGGTSFEQLNRTLSGRLSGEVDWKRYLGDGPFSITASGDGSWRYAEIDRYSHYGNIVDDETFYTHQSSLAVATGVGLGRLRNVVPYLRAQRLSERLTALGRPALTPAQVQQVAQVLAQEPGYRSVFDRADRRFWEDVLTPMLADGAPLSVFEIFYLTDVLREHLGDRYEGFELRAEVSYTEAKDDYGFREHSARRRGPRLRAAWYHHLSLHHQLMVTAGYGYQWQSGGSGTNDSGALDLSLGHLWNFADRYRLDTSVALGGDSVIQAESRQRRVDLQSTLNIYLEDRVSLQAGVAGRYTSESIQTDEFLRWDWTYQLGLSYHLDRLFFTRPGREI